MMLTCTPAPALVVAAILFGCGVLGVMLRRNVLIVLMSIELMLNGANLTLVAFSRLHQQAGLIVPQGQWMALFGIAIAAAEAAVGLAIVVGVFRNRRSIQLHDMNLLQS